MTLAADPISIAAYRRAIGESIIRNFAEWSRMPPEEWAESIYRLPNGGRFKWSYAPYAREMLRSIFDPRNIETVFQLYSRGLKSTVVLLAIGYIIDQAPRRILSLWPTNSQAEKYRKDVLNGELFDTTACLNHLGSAGKKRDGTNTLLHFLFAGGLMDLFGANAPGDMRRAKGSFLYADEIDAISTEQTDEGDQLAIFNKRGDEYPDTIRVFASYPSLKGYSRIQSKLEGTDWKEWRVTCVKCGGEPYVMHRSQLRYDEDAPQNAVLECPRCNAFLSDANRHAMMLNGSWKATREYRGRSGFHGNALLWPHPFDPVKMPGGALQMIADQEIAANKSENPRRSMRVVVNTVDAEPFDPVAENEQPPEWRTIFESREDYGLTVPDGGLFLTAFVDCQLNRLEVGWRAYGREEESWGMDHVVLDGYIRHAEVWTKLKQELSRKWTHASGAPMTLGMGMVDGGAYAEDVYRFFQDLARNPIEGLSGHIRASKGEGKHGHPIISRKMQTVAKNLKGHHIGTWEAKDRIYARLRQPAEMVAGKMHFNRQYQEEYFQQLTVERVTIEYDGGEEIRKYENAKNERNEALDIEVGCLAALRLFPRNYDQLRERITEDAEHLKAGAPVAKKVPQVGMAGSMR